MENNRGLNPTHSDPQIELELEPPTEFISRFKTKCLIGKVILCYAYPLQERDVKRFVSDSWKCNSDFSVTTVSHNTFVFRFQEHRDCMHVLLNVPWNVRGGLLILSPWKPGQKPENFNFSFSPFWVQVHRLPPEYMTPVNGVKIGKVLGKFMYSERNTPGSGQGKLPEREFLRLRVVLDIRQPLLTRYLVKRAGLSDIWIQFKYENLGVFCFKCGKIGTYHWACKHPQGTLNYSSELSVLPCSDAPLIRFPQMNTMLKESSDSGLQVNEEEKSSDQMFDKNENFSTRVPQMTTKLKESSGSEQEVDEEEKEMEEESSDQMFDTNENFSRVPQMNTMLTESSDSEQEVEEKGKESEEESEDQMFDANEKLSTRSGMQMLVINGLVTMVMILNCAVMHRRVAAGMASEANPGRFENWKLWMENWKMIVVMIVYFGCLLKKLIRVSPISWLVNVTCSGSSLESLEKLEKRNINQQMKSLVVSLILVWFLMSMCF